MVHYKLTYFNLKGLGEPIRFLLNYMGKEFEDHRIEYSEWESLKPYTPFGKLPTLEIDGEKFCQSSPICRYLAREAGLDGKNERESLRIASFVEAVQDLRVELSKYRHEKNEKMKEQKRTNLLNDIIPFYMSRFDDTIKKNSGFVANGALSWGDIFFASFIDTMNGMMGMDVSSKYPNVVNLQKKIFSLPRIKEYIQKRPKNEF